MAGLERVTSGRKNDTKPEARNVRDMNKIKVIDPIATRIDEAY